MGNTMPMMKPGQMAGKAAKTPKPAMAKPMGGKPAKAMPMRGQRTATNKGKK
jgi:hypothetical protein